MSTTYGNPVIHAVVSQANYNDIISKNDDTIYFVITSDGIKLYKGSTLINKDGGFKVLQSNPSDVTSMVEGVLYLAPNGKFYYKSGSTLAVAFDLVQETTKNVSSNASQVPSVTAMYAAIAAEIASAMSGTYRSNILSPVADVTALKAVTGMQDKDVIFVESLNSMFSYDAQSSATANDTTVVAPTSGGGRWLKTQGSFAYDSTDFQWGSNGLELKVKLPTGTPSDGQVLAWDATNSVLKWITPSAGNTGIEIVTSDPSVTSTDNGKVFYNSTTGRLNVVESGQLVQKSYSKAELDAILKWNVIS